MSHKDKKRKAEYQKEWEKKNRPRRRLLIKKWEEERKDFIRSLRIACVSCGETHPAVLDFHHRDADSKTFNLGSFSRHGWSKKRILEEAGKCDVLCSNCHRKLHWDEKNAAKAVRICLLAPSLEAT